jgi:hypothetical protein
MPSFEVSIKLDLPAHYGTFQDVEQKILAAQRQAGAELLGKILQGREEQMLSERVCQKKDRRPKNIGTLLGKIRIQRWRVFDVFKGQIVTPLDEWLGMTDRHGMSVGLRKEIIKQCVVKPYRQASQDVAAITGVTRSAMGHWKFIQAHSRAEQKKEPGIPSGKAMTLRKLESDEVDPCPMLGIDPDETYVRPRRKTDKNHSLKMAVIYTGRKPMHPKSGKRRVLMNKQIVMSKVDEKAPRFFDKVMHKAVYDYGAHQGTKVICHGDGDAWIKQLKDYYLPQTLNRLDPYHVFEKMRQAIGVKELPNEWVKNFYRDPDLLITRVKDFRKGLAEEGDRDKVKKLIVYLHNNRDGMMPSGVSREVKRKHPHMYKRGSGTIESNIFWGICQRFKRARMTWSRNGLENLRFLRERHLNESMSFQKMKWPTGEVPASESQRMNELREAVRDL